jgi:sec-independent protein translocase protein TatA
LVPRATNDGARIFVASACRKGTIPERITCSRPRWPAIGTGEEKKMGGFSAWHWIIVALVILVLFGRGKISETMGDFGKGIKSFRKGLGEEEKAAVPPPAPPPQIAAPPAASEPPSTSAPAPDTTAATTDSSSNSS